MSRPLKYRLNGHNVRLLNAELANRVATQTGTAFDGWEELNINSLDDATRDELVAMVPLLSKMRDPEDALAANKEFNEATIKLGSVGAAQRAKNQEEGQAQLNAYYAAGLEDSKHNADLVTQWIMDNAKGIFGAASVRSAIEFQRAQLRWKKIEPVLTAAPVVQQPEAITLSDGTKQLPLGTTPSPGHSLAQLRDLDQRERAARGRAAGTFGTRF